MLEELLNQVTKKTTLFNLEDIGKVIQYLVGEFYQPLYLREKRYREVRVEKGSSSGVKTINKNSPEQSPNTNLIKPVTAFLTGSKPPDSGYNGGGKRVGSFHGSISDDDTFCNPWRELYLWALLLHRLDLAETFWTEGMLASPVTIILNYNKIIYFL